jgi:uncharacterized protein YgiM (DUF1202 family)
MNDTNEIRQRNLERLKRMRDEGILTADEFQRERTEVFRLNPVIQAEVAPVQEATIDQSEANDTTEDYIYGTAHEEPNQSEYGPARSVGEWFWVVPLATLSILLVATGYIYLSKARVHTGLYEVTARTLNCRAEPTSSSSIVTQFTQGQEISVIDKQNDWLNVNADIECWVSSKFAQKKETKSNNNDTENAPPVNNLSFATSDAVIGVNPAYLEQKLGVPREKSKGSSVFEVGGCTINYRYDDNGVTGFYLDITRSCQPTIRGRKVSPNTTFGSLLAMEKWGKYLASCLYSCGNAADPVIDLSYPGSRSTGFISISYSTDYDQSSVAMGVWEQSLRRSLGLGEFDTPEDTEAFSCVQNPPANVRKLLPRMTVKSVWVTNDDGPSC